MSDLGRRTLEALRVLASEASLAIEQCATVPEGGQTSGMALFVKLPFRGTAIATLVTPNEMLTKITDQWNRGLTYDHIGIGGVDYASERW